MMMATVLMMIATMAICTGCGDSGLSDWAYIEDKGTLVVGLDDTFAPMGFRDEDDNIVGFDIDLANAVGKELGVEVEFKSIDWDAKDQELESKNIDCIWNGMSWTEERNKTMSLSNKYMNNRIMIMSDKNINITDSAQLADYKIGAQVDSSAMDGIKADKNYDLYKDNVKEYGDYAAAYLDMKAGRIDVMVIDAVMGQYTYPELKTSDFVFMDEYFAIGFRKDDTELTAKVNDALDTLLSNGEGAKISQKWFNNPDVFVVVK